MPHHIGAGRNGLSGTDAVAIVRADELAQTKLEDGDEQWDDAQSYQCDARHGRMENALHGQSHDDGEIEAPQIEAEIATVTNPFGHMRQVTACEQGQAQWYDEHDEHPLEYHEKGKEKTDVGTLFHHWEEKRDDDRGDAVGDEDIHGHRLDAASKLLGDHRCGGGSGTDEADEHAFEDELPAWRRRNGYQCDADG